MYKYSMISTALMTSLCFGFSAQAAGKSEALSPVGAWDTIITPDDPERAPFQGFHIYNFGGTQTNSNTACNRIAPSPTHGLRCSDGYGVWERTSAHRFVQTFYLEVFNPSGQHFAFIKSRGVFSMEGKNLMTGYNEVFLYVGTDLENPVVIMPLGTETFEARRITAELPDE